MMLKNKTTQKPNDIYELAKQIADFPVTARIVVRYATKLGFDSDVVRVLKSFPKNEPFTSQDDLIIRFEDLDILMKEERQTITEFVRTP